ncbi:glycoside hydrolase family 9 protein [Cohnella cholangitidis]|uniref:Fibronectin type-III domain-containing protein n=1 Tax=Cohnella cholangitidis TaxID=2598458 RepID=A0A7G5C0E4_9BACL|nr:glycoside hydrolase family 9 protein [Cohnella cholangitidis]QMV42678.1 hypothetical protein FPL14_16895 [Cohnella cholangitidis]
MIIRRNIWLSLICICMCVGSWPVSTANAAIPGATVQKYIMVDQFGYRPNDDKVAVLVDPQVGYNASDSYTPGSTLQVRRASDDAVVFAGAPQIWNQGATQEKSGDRGWWFDFSSVTTEGDYYIYDVEGNFKSYEFKIAADVYKEVLKAAIKTFYYQRIGTPHLAEHAGAAFADGPAFVGPHQDMQARNVFDRNNPATERDLSGGWMDAGDFNKYPTFTAQPINELLSAYEQNPDIFTDDYNIPESGNGIPDVLDEVKWELDWLKKMQESDGGVLMKMGVPGDGKIGEFNNPPSTSTIYRYYLPKSSASTIVTALNFAHAANTLQNFPTLQSYAADLKERAIKAFNWYQTNPKTENADHYEIEAGPSDVPLAQQAQVATVAAAYLFALTGDQTYHTYFKNNYGTTWPMSDAYWGLYYGEQADGVMFYTTLPNADPAVKAHILERRDLHDFSQEFTDNDDLYRSFVPDFSYHWGSLQVRARSGASSYDFVQYDINPQKRANFDKKAQNVLHYFHGVNPLGLTYLTNMEEYGAENPIKQIYHEWFSHGSQWDYAPPGFVPGGPSEQYSGTEFPPRDQPAQKMYKDWNGTDDPWHNDKAWEITENGIYYQAAYVKLLAKFVTAPPAPTEPPGVPVGVVAAATGTTSIKVNWTKPTGATGYDIEVDGVAQNNGPALALEHTGLAPGSTHSYRVRAKNNLGTSEWSAPVTAVTEVPPLPPEAPVGLNAAATSAFDIAVNWDASARATSYDIEVDGTIVVNGALTSYAHTGIASTSTHSYRVRATNSGGTSEWSAVVSATTPQAPPTSVIDVSHNGTQGYTFGQSSDQVTRYETFVASPYPELTGVEVKIRKGGSPGNVTVELYETIDNKPTGSALASATIAAGSVTEDYQVLSAALKYSGLQYGKKYAIVLGQTNPGVGGGYEWLAGTDVNSGFEFGKYTGSSYVDESHIGDGWMKLYVALSSDPQPQPPAVPAGVTAGAASNSSIALSWAAVTGATGYEIEIDGSSAYVSTTNTSYVHDGLAAGTSHTYKVRATNSAGTSGWSAFVTATTGQASSSVIDLSHNGTDGYTFGEKQDQIKRWQTFAANANSKLSKVELKLRKFNNASNLTVSLYATEDNKPTGSALATATVKSASVSEDFAVVSVPLAYSGLTNGTVYAIVLGQSTNSDFSNYEWCTSEVSASLKYGKYSGGKWIDESGIGDGWLKAYVGQ